MPAHRRAARATAASRRSGDPRVAQPRLSLTARLAVGAIVASLLPFAVALAAISVLPWSTVTHHVRAQQAIVERDLAGRTTLRRATLREAVAQVPDDVLAAAVAQGGAAGAARVRTSLRHGPAASDVGSSVAVDLRRGATGPATDDPPVTVFLRAGTTGVVVHEPVRPGELRAAASDADLQLAVLTVAADGSTHVIGRSPGRGMPRITARRPRATTGRAGDAAATATSPTPDVEVHGASRGVVRVQALDPDGRTILVARATGTRLDLLVHDRRSDLGLAFVLLALAGVVGGLASALLVNRGLWGVARVARTIAGGNYDARLPVAGRDAAADVAASLNELAADLDDRIGRLNRTVEQLDRILESIDDGVCLWDSGGELRFHNAAAATILGTLGEADDERDVARIALRAQLRPGRRRAMLPVSGVGPGGATTHAHVAVDLAVVRTRDGGMLQVFHDATRAISLDQARRNFLVTAAHELRTPLAAIVGMVDTLCTPDFDLDQASRDELLRHVGEQTERLDRVVNAFFENSLLGRDRIEVTLGATLLRPAVDEVAEAAPLAELDAESLDGSVAVQADRRALVRALAELVDNAAKYGEGPVRITTSAMGGSVAIEVVDGGAGVPADQLEAVFEPFVRLDPEMRTGHGGVGLGLYTARRLVEAMAGTIEIVPRDGDLDGRVRVTLPAAPANLTPMPMNANWHRDNPMPRNADERQRAEWHLEHRDACGCRPVPDNILERVAQIEAERDQAPADV